MTTADHLPRRTPDVPAALAGDATDAGEIELNATAYAIWELCDGTTSIDEMVAAATDLFDAPAETIAADVRRILAELHDVGLVEWVDHG